MFLWVLVDDHPFLIGIVSQPPYSDYSLGFHRFIHQYLKPETCQTWFSSQYWHQLIQRSLVSCSYLLVDSSQCHPLECPEKISTHIKELFLKYVIILCGDQPPLSPCHFAPHWWHICLGCWQFPLLYHALNPSLSQPCNCAAPAVSDIDNMDLQLSRIQWKFSHFHFVIGCVEADADEDDFLDRVSESAPVQCGWPWWHPDDSPADAYYPHCSVVTPGCRALYARERQRRADKKCTELVARIHLRLPERLCCCCLSANGTRPLMFLSTATCLSTIATNNACLHPDHL